MLSAVIGKAKAPSILDTPGALRIACTQPKLEVMAKPNAKRPARIDAVEYFRLGTEGFVEALDAVVEDVVVSTEAMVFLVAMQ